MKNNTDNPLVTIGVITYNSAKSVIETLDSIYNQTYENLELIISDDCSKDDTVKVCTDWISLHSDRFKRTKIITSEKNTGISGNCNRLIAEVKGVWYKGIAGDDVLFKDAIKYYYAFATINNSRVIASKAKYYNDKIEEGYFNKDETNLIFNKNYPKRFGSAKEELKKMIFGNWICSPTVFYHTSVFKEVGPYDEKFQMCDDYPYYIRILEHNIRIQFMDAFTVGYRVSMSNTCREKGKLYKLDFQRMLFEIQKKYCFRYYSGRQKRRTILLLHIKIIMEKLDLNRSTSFCNNLLLFLNRLTFFVL